MSAGTLLARAEGGRAIALLQGYETYWRVDRATTGPQQGNLTLTWYIGGDGGVIGPGRRTECETQGCDSRCKAAQRRLPGTGAAFSITARLCAAVAGGSPWVRGLRARDRSGTRPRSDSRGSRRRAALMRHFSSYLHSSGAA